MDRWTTLAIGALLPDVGFALGVPPSAPASASRTLTRAQFDALRASSIEVLIVDVRRPDEIAALGGFAAYLNVQPADVARSRALIPRDRTIVTVSNRATRAGRVADELAAQGFRVAGALGAQDYEAAGGSLTRFAPRAAAAASAQR